MSSRNLHKRDPGRNFTYANPSIGQPVLFPLGSEPDLSGEAELLERLVFRLWMSRLLLPGPCSRFRRILSPNLRPTSMPRREPTGWSTFLRLPFTLPP